MFSIFFFYRSNRAIQLAVRAIHKRRGRRRHSAKLLGVRHHRLQRLIIGDVGASQEETGEHGAPRLRGMRQEFLEERQPQKTREALLQSEKHCKTLPLLWSKVRQAAFPA